MLLKLYKNKNLRQAISEFLYDYSEEFDTVVISIKYNKTGKPSIKIKSIERTTKKEHVLDTEPWLPENYYWYSYQGNFIEKLEELDPQERPYANQEGFDNWESWFDGNSLSLVHFIRNITTCSNKFLEVVVEKDSNEKSK